MISWLHSTYHSVLCMPNVTIFQSKILFDIPYTTYAGLIFDCIDRNKNPTIKNIKKHGKTMFIVHGIMDKVLVVVEGISCEV